MDRAALFPSREDERPENSRARQLDGAALQQVEALLAGETPVRDRLIEYLHLIQDAYGHLSAAHMRALAEIMRLPMARIMRSHPSMPISIS